MSKKNPELNIETNSALKDFSSGFSNLADAFAGMKLPDIPLDIDNLFPDFQDLIRPQERQVFQRKDIGHRVLIKKIIKSNPYNIVEYSHIDTRLDGTFRAQEKIFLNTWSQPCDVKVARINGIPFKDTLNHVELDVFGRRRMSVFKKGQIWATTLAVFEVVGTFAGKNVDDQVYLKCKGSIHPDLVKDEIYWDYPEHVERNYRHVESKN